MQGSRKLLLLTLLSSAVLLAECSPRVSRTVVASTTPTGAATTASTVPHYTEAQVAEGKAIYTNSCGKCHKYVVPATKSITKWESILPSMIRKAKLDETQGNLVRAYVMANLK